MNCFLLKSAFLLALGLVNAKENKFQESPLFLSQFVDYKDDSRPKKSLEEQIYEKWGDEAVEKLSSWAQ